MSEQDKGAAGAGRRNYVLWLANGCLAMLADRIASPQLVLPWVYGIIGGPLYLLGLLIPSVRIGAILSEMAIVPMMRAVTVRKWFNVAATLIIASLLTIICIAILDLSIFAATIVFFVSTLSFGACNGIVQLTSQEIMAKTIPHHRIGSLVATQASLGGALTLAFVVAWFFINPFPGSETRHLVMIASAAVVWVAAAIAFALIAEQPSVVQPKPSLWSEIRKGAGLFRQSPWFRRYTTARVLYLSVGLAMPFYSIHAASLYKGATHNLSIYIVAVGVANMVSGLVWGRLLTRNPVMVLVLTGVAAAAAGGLAIARDLLSSSQWPYPYALVFFVLGLAMQGLTQGSKTYVALMAPGDDRPLYLAANNAFLGVLAIGFSGVLGVVAHFTHIVWALVALIAFALAASTYAIFLIAPSRD